MHRLVALAKGCLAAACLVAAGCASGPVAQSPTPSVQATASAPVSAGPRDCAALRTRIHGSDARDAVITGTWLDAPLRMAEGRRVRALEARAAELGCALPRS
jgi:hypothetical protein